MNLLRLSFSFCGRVNRAGFWIVSMTWLVVSVVLTINWPEAGVSAILLGGHEPVALAGAVIAIPVLVSSVAVCVRRLHDRDKSAWWLVLYVLCPPLLEVIAAVPNLDSALAVALMVLSIAIGLWTFIDLGCIPGTEGANRYGPDPLAGAAA
jgi:uncharacterized membrane protein YhaH (DUF805 family)